MRCYRMQDASTSNCTAQALAWSNMKASDSHEQSSQSSSSNSPDWDRLVYEARTHLVGLT